MLNYKVGIDIVDIKRLARIIGEDERYLIKFLPIGWLSDLKNLQTIAGRVALFEATIKAFPKEHMKILKETVFAYDELAPKVILPPKIAVEYSIEVSISHSANLAIATCLVIAKKIQ